MAFRKIYERIVAIEKHDDHCDVITYFEAYCNSEDVKPTKLVAEGSNAMETDTGDWYFFKEDTGEWEKKFNIATGGRVNATNLTVLSSYDTQTILPSDVGDYNYFSKVTVHPADPININLTGVIIRDPQLDGNLIFDNL